LEVLCAKALQQRAGLLGNTRCHFPGIAHSFGFGLLMAVAGNVMLLSSTKMGALSIILNLWSL
jgi:hypothetical protein